MSKPVFTLCSTNSLPAVWKCWLGMEVPPWSPPFSVNTKTCLLFSWQSCSDCLLTGADVKVRLLPLVMTKERHLHWKWKGGGRANVREFILDDQGLSSWQTTIENPQFHNGLLQPSKLWSEMRMDELLRLHGHCNNLNSKHHADWIKKWLTVVTCSKFNAYCLLSCRNNSKLICFAFADSLWPCIKVKVTKMSMSTYHYMPCISLPSYQVCVLNTVPDMTIKKVSR